MILETHEIAMKYALIVFALICASIIARVLYLLIQDHQKEKAAYTQIQVNDYVWDKALEQHRRVLKVEKNKLVVWDAANGMQERRFWEIEIL